MWINNSTGDDAGNSSRINSREKHMNHRSAQQSMNAKRKNTNQDRASDWEEELSIIPQSEYLTNIPPPIILQYYKKNVFLILKTIDLKIENKTPLTSKIPPKFPISS